MNRILHEATTPVLYQNIVLKFSDLRGLLSAVSDIMEGPQRHNFLKYARRLHIICCSYRGYRQKLATWEVDMMNEEDSMRKSFQDYWLTSYIWLPREMKSKWIRPGYIRETPGAWEPIANLISCLDTLCEINYIARNEFSRSLHQAISKYHPYCRLNIPVVPYVYDSTLVEAQKNWPRGDLSLAGLQSLVMTVGNETQEKDLDNMMFSAFSVAGLKQLKIECRWNDLSDNFSVFSDKWQAPVNAFSTNQASNVESLALHEIGLSDPYRFGLLAESLIMKLATAGYATGLRTLDIGTFYNANNLSRIAGLFPNLERLFIDPNQIMAASKTDNEDSIAGICAFKPLKWLCIRDLHNTESLHRITEKHGQTLKGLILVPNGMYEPAYPKLNTSDILQLATNCPYLEELRIPITRSMGNHDEFDKYKALGTLAKLRSLVLDLNIGLPPGARPHTPAWINGLSFFQKFVINGAIDERLASGIWNLIKTSQSSRLQYLRIVPMGDYLIYSSGRTNILLLYFARSFLVSRYNLCEPDCPSIDEIGKGVQSMLRNKSLGGYFPKYEQDCRLPEEAVEILRGIWPQWPQGDKMWAGWTSFPLQADSEE